MNTFVKLFQQLAKPLPLVLTLLAQPHLFAATPADYTIPMHIQTSNLEMWCTSDNKGSTCSLVQHLHVLISGKKYELARTAENVFRTGDYKVRVVTEKKPRTEEYSLEYELLLSDGKTAKFSVIGESE